MEKVIVILDEQKIIQDLLPRKFDKSGKLWVTLLSVFCLLGVYAWYRQLRYGLEVTAMRDYVSWGLYISNFVFFVAISLVGSLITAILRIANVTWSTPLTRIAEMIAIAAIMFAALIIVIDMGRPERLLNVFIHGRIQSPIIWDVVVITTYFFISLLLLYLPLLPDIKILRENSVPAIQPFQKFYRFIGGFWKETNEQHRISTKAINILCITIIPVAFCIHTVTSWLFATTFRPGWDSTNFGGYFISGAFLAGSGAVIVAMFVVRKAYRLNRYITDMHFDKMGKILVLLAFVYLYFNVNEYLVPAFKMKEGEEAHLQQLFTGDWAFKFWATILISMIIPIIMLVFKKGRKPLPMFIAGLMVVTGAWFKRYIIVVPSMLHPFLPMHDVPESYRHYFPSWEEWAIAGGSLAGALLIVTLLVRIFPIVPIRETLDEMKTTR